MPKLSKVIYGIFVIFILIVSFVYRNRYYWEFPPLEENFDEFAYGWLGASLVKTGIPTSWSFIPDYVKGYKKGMEIVVEGFAFRIDGVLPNRENYRNFPKPMALAQDLNLDGYRSQFRIVSPYLEQPPLGGLIISLPLLSSDIQKLTDVSLRALRKPFVYYGVIATFMVIWLTNLWYSKGVALSAGAIYATVPTIVLGSRYALPENLLTLLLLGFLIILEYYRRSRKPVLLVLAY